MHSAGADVVQEGGDVDGDGDGDGGDGGADDVAAAAAAAPHFSFVPGLWKQHRPLLLPSHSRAGLIVVAVVTAVLKGGRSVACDRQEKGDKLVSLQSPAGSVPPSASHRARPQENGIVLPPWVLAAYASLVPAPTQHAALPPAQATAAPPTR